MTITSRCPNCDQFCAFEDDLAGRNARCLNCDQRFTIPSADLQPAESLSDVPQEPLPDFYREALVNSWKIFADRKSVFPLVFIAAVTCLRFFMGHTDYSFTAPGFRLQVPTGQIATVVTLGCIFWYYMELIFTTASGISGMPEPQIDSGFAFLWNIIRSVYLFLVSFIIVQIPFILLAAALDAIGIGLPPYISLPLMLVGVFAFPMVILTITTGRGLWMVFFPKYIITPITKAFWPYSIVAIMVMLSMLFHYLLIFYSIEGKSSLIVTLELAAILVCTAFTIIAMRSIGLFCKHYSCHLPQLGSA